MGKKVKHRILAQKYEVIRNKHVWLMCFEEVVNKLGLLEEFEENIGMWERVQAGGTAKISTKITQGCSLGWKHV